MLFGDHDESASDPTMTCLPPDRVRADLERFEIEHWSVEEDDRPTALDEPHHFHLIEFVARRTAQRKRAASPHRQMHQPGPTCADLPEFVY
ncbi:MAG: hypothetical protein ABSE58_03135 [Candidatus Limnocylindrales bacterium]|jgi:hypothetical protein